MGATIHIVVPLHLLGPSDPNASSSSLGAYSGHLSLKFLSYGYEELTGFPRF